MMKTTTPRPDGHELMDILLNEVLRAYANCEAERAKLHEVEWSSGEDSPSVLGEAEVLADAVAGVVQTMLTRGAGPKHPGVLAKLGTHRSPTLHEWLTQSDSEYPAFAVYLQTVELLRTVALHQLGDDSAPLDSK